MIQQAPIPSDFDLGNLRPTVPTDIVVTAGHGDNAYRLPLPVTHDQSYLCPHGQRERTERMQADTLRAGHVLQGCQPAGMEPGAVTVGVTRIRDIGRPRVPGISITLHQ